MSKQKIIFLIFLALAFACSLVGWITLKGVLFNGSATAGVLVVASIFLLMGVLLGLVSILFSSLWLLVLASTFSFFPLFPLFGAKLVYLGFFVLGIIFILFEAGRAFAEKKARMRISLADISKPALVGVFTALALMISVIIYFSPPAQNIKIDIKVPRSIFNFVVSSMTSVAPTSLIPVNQILDEETKEKLYQSVNNQVNFFIQQYKRYLPYGLAVAVFISLKAVSFIFVWIAIGLINIIFPIMKRMGWVNIKKEMVEKEIIEF